jgi:hypothetical protein
MEILMESPANLSESHKFITPTRIVLFLFLAVLLSAVVAIGKVKYSQPKNGHGENTINDPAKIVNLSAHMIVYGTWSEKGSEIIAYDLSTGKEGVIANLPVTIKKVTVLSKDALMYIDETDIRDHGQQIVKYDLNTKEVTPIVVAAEGFGIDDYVISPNKQYLATWEVKVNPDSGTLLDGTSRVYSAQVTADSHKNLIYDEQSTDKNPVHYPRAILDNGSVFSDRFLPNSGAGWAYGMSISNFSGSERKDISSMPNGTYGTQPELSPDGKYLVFAGYNRSDGTSIIDGFRHALLEPNTVELLDTNTLQRKPLINLSSTNTYSSVSWNDASSLLLSIASKQVTSSGIFIYSLASQTLVAAPQVITDEGTVVKQLSDTTWLTGEINTDSTATANLGDHYSTPYTSFVFYNPTTKTSTQLKTHNELMQLITVMPTTSFGSFQTNIEEKTPSDNNLQLKTFSVKTQLAPTREEQQSSPRKTERTQERGAHSNPSGDTNPESGLPKCNAFSSSQISSTCGSRPPSGVEHSDQQIAYDTCSRNIIRSNRESGRCYDSPLYLYGEAGQNVTVVIHTPIYNAIPDQNGAVNVTLKANGALNIGGKTYGSIAFDYKSALKHIIPPTKGVVVTRENVPATLQQFAANLGLNAKETQDLLAKSNSLTASPYVFVSFFDNEASKAILPITFNPKPNVYRNIVFYFKNLDKPLEYSIAPPAFEKIERKGFTAVEISEIVE